MHRLGAVAHKSSTRLCTGSREAVLLSAGRQQRIGVGAGTCRPASAPRARSRDTLVPSPPLPGKDRCPPLPGSRRPQVGAKSRVRPALVGTDMIKVLANRKPVPAADGCRILCNLSVAAGILVTHTVDICAMRAKSQSQAFEAKLARLMWQAGKRCYRRRPRRR